VQWITGPHGRPIGRKSHAAGRVTGRES
jgi:hypothetical protein